MIGDNTKIGNDTGWEPAVGSDRMLADLLAYWEERIAAAVGKDLRSGRTGCTL